MWDVICSFICHEQSFEESDVVTVLIYDELFPLQKKKKKFCFVGMNHRVGVYYTRRMTQKFC
jgi:hypothetical protein